MEGLNSPDGLAAAHDIAAPLATARAILLDWDGCAAIDNRPLPITLEFLRAYGERVAIVSNNSTLLPGDIVEVLATAGVQFPAERVLLAGCEAIATAAQSRGARALVLASLRMRALAHRSGLNLVKKGADLVVLLRDTRFSYAKLDRAAEALRRGARLIVANPDKTHPAADGAVVPETGALLAAIAACVDLDRVDVEIIGKPSGRLFQRACQVLGATPDKAVMIGDNPLTDVAGATAAGMASILVAPGSSVTLRELLPPRDRSQNRLIESTSNVWRSTSVARS
jgi:4-nitrophenyl phosphatase